MASPSKRFTWKRLVVGSLALLLVGWAGFELVLRSDWFQEQLRQRLIAEIEQATGGEAQLDTLRFDPSSMTVELENLRLYGRGESEPFGSFPHVAIALGIESILARSIRLDSLELDQPALILRIAEDGTTNWPGQPDSGTAASVTDIGLGHLVVSRASLVFNGEPYGLDFAATDVALTATRDAEGCYGFATTVGSVEGTPVAWYDGISLTSDVQLCGSRMSIRQAEVESAAFGTWRGTGTVDSIPDPVVDVDFSFEAPLALLSQELATGWGVTGSTTGTGKLTRTPQEPLAYEGSVAARTIAVTGPAGQLTGGRLEAVFAGDLDTLRVSSMRLDLADGSVAGEASVEDLRGDWLLQSTGIVDAVRADALARTATARLPWATQVSGTYDVTATERGGAGLSSSLVFTDPQDAEFAGMVGQVALAYASETSAWQILALDLAVPGIEVSASGWHVAGGPTELQYDVRAETQSDIEGLIAMFDPSIDPPPITLSGETSMVGTVSSPNGAFALDTAEIEADVLTGGIELLGYPWQRMSASLKLADGRLEISDGRFVDGSSILQFSGQTTIRDEVELTDWPFVGQVIASNLDITKLAPTVGLTTEVTGSLDATVDLDGPLISPSGSVQFNVRNGSLSGNALDSLAGTATYNSGLIDASDIAVRRGDTSITGSGRYVIAEREFSVDLVGADILLRDLPAFDEDSTTPSGLLALDVALSGALASADSTDRFETLAINGSWRLQDLTLGEVALGDWSGEATSDDDQIELTLLGTPLAGSVSGAGVIEVAHLGFTTDIRFDNLAFGSLLASDVSDSASPSGIATGQAKFSGSLDSLSELVGDGSFSELRLDVAGVPGSDEGYELYNPFPMRWTFSGGQLNLDHMRLQGIGTNVELTGAVGVAPGIESDLRIDGDFELAALQQLMPTLTASGRSTIGVRLTGALADPEVQGEWNIQDGVLQSESFPAGLSRINGQVMFVGREVRVEQMRALSGGGILTLSGGGRLGPDDYEFRLDGNAEGVRVRYPAGITSLVDGDFVFSGGADQRLLSGEVVILRLSTLRTTTLGSILAELRSRTPTASQEAPLDSVQVNVHVASAPGVEINTSLIRNVAAGIDLRLVGSLGNPSLLGQINISQGQMTFHGSRYAINRGQIEFRNPVRVEPILDFEMETRMRGVDIALILAGPARRLNISYRSDPPLSFSELVNLVAVGRDPSADPLYSSQQRIEQQSLFQTGANNVVANAVQSPVSPGLQRFFGVSRLKVDPGVGGADSNPAARISTEQTLADDITLIYTYDLSSTQQQTLRLEWTPDRRWTFVLVRDENGLVGSDAIYKLRRR